MRQEKERELNYQFKNRELFDKRYLEHRRG